MTGPSLASGVFGGSKPAAALAAVAYSGQYNDLLGRPTLGTAASQDSSVFATAAQGLLASTALQPGAQIPWTDVTGKPAFGSAALQDSSAFAAAAHTHTASQISDASANGRSLITAADYAAMRTLLALVKGTSAGNIPVLDGSGKLDTSIIPAYAISEPFVVASQAAMLALTAQTGDVAIRTDLNKSFILATNSPSTLADWKELLTPTDAVLSVAALTGAISAAALKTALAIAVADITDMSANGRLLVAMTYANMFAAIKQAATTSATGVVELATTAEYRNNTTGLALSTDQVNAAGAFFGLTDGATISWDMNSGWNASVTIAGNRTFGNPTNPIVGRSGVLKVKQDATGSRTASFSANWDAAGGTMPVLTTAANAEDHIFYYVNTTTSIVITGIAKAVS